MLTSKEDWNNFLDNFGVNHCMYPHTILLMMSNRTPEDIEKADNSVLNHVRVDRRIHLEMTDEMRKVQENLMSIE